MHYIQTNRRITKRKEITYEQLLEYIMAQSSRYISEFAPSLKKVPLDHKLKYTNGCLRVVVETEGHLEGRINVLLAAYMVQVNFWLQHFTGIYKLPYKLPPFDNHRR